MISAQGDGGSDPVRQAFALAGGENAALDAAGGHRGFMQPCEAGERGVKPVRLFRRGKLLSRRRAGLGELVGERLATRRFHGHCGERRGGRGHGQ